MNEHVHEWRYVSPGKRDCACGARLAVEVPTDQGMTLRGRDIAWAQEMAQKGRHDG